MKVCDLPNGNELHCTMFGTPLKRWLQGNHDSLSYGKYTFPCDIGHVNMADWQAVDKWQRNPDHDCLRSRGDLRWQAACVFTAMPRWWIDENGEYQQE